MHVVIAGGSGLLGTALSSALIRDGHTVSVLTRGTPRAGTSTTPAHVHWQPSQAPGPWTTAIEGADAVVNLAGESIGERRWTQARKEKILGSRTNATASLVQAIDAATLPPTSFISASAVGYYGPQASNVVRESTPAGGDFLARVCDAWERAASGVRTRTRLVAIRTGLVLSRSGGALPKMLPPFRLGAGGRLGSGRQYWPWIHVDDWVSAVRFAIRSEAAEGPINVTAPRPVPNATFAAALGRAMHRPALVATPGFALKLLLGEMADGLLLSGQRAVPDKLRELGFAFQYEQIDDALADLFRRNLSTTPRVGPHR